MAGVAGREAPILTVSVAAELAGMHPQTLRQYDRLGLVPAKRTRGGGRRYSLADVDKLLEIQELSQNEGINLAGISRIMDLRDEVETLKKQQARLRKRLADMQEMFEAQRALEQRVFAAGADGDVVMFARAEEIRRRLREEAHEAVRSSHEAHSAELVVWRPWLEARS
ncbi:helix-turn-helix transcriptional regulator [Arcanobacterium haemolyticum]|nr:helix-turn-helix transcriptional regulator [Arcanobacterium haemolyticum]